MSEIALVTVLVDDYDDAIDFYVGAMGFERREDTDLGDGKRWIVVAPPGSTGTGLLLATASDDAQRSPASATRPADGWRSSCTPTTSNGITPE